MRKSTFTLEYSSNLCIISDLLKSECAYKAKETESFIEIVYNQMIEPLNNFIKSSKKKYKEVYKIWCDLEISYYDKQSEFKETEGNYLREYIALENGIRSYENTDPKAKSGKEKKLIKEVYKLYLKFKNAEKAYTKDFYKLKETRLNYIKELKSTLDSLQKIEEGQIEAFKSCFIMYNSKNLERATNLLNGVQEQNNKLESNIMKQREIQRIIEKYKTKEQNIKEPSYNQVKINCKGLIEEFDKIYFNKQSIDKLDLKIFNVKDNNTDAKLFHTLLNYCWTSNLIPTDVLNEFTNLIQTEQGRTHFTQALNYYRVQGIAMIPKEGYETLGDLIMRVLDEADKANDTNTPLRILILAQTYYAKINNEHNKKVYLQQYIEKHIIWTKKEFWDKAISQMIIEESKVSLLYKESENERAQRIQTLILGRLKTFAYEMIQFGMEVEQVKELITVYAEKSKVEILKELDVIEYINIGDN